MRKNNGLAGVDIIIAIIAITIFSTLIISMIYSNVMENVKLKKETLAMIYITEIFENIGIEDYNNLPIGSYQNIKVNEYDERIEQLVPDTILEGYIIDMVITENLDGVTTNEGILKKIQITITYEVGEKTFSSSMERLKIKE